MTKAIKDFLEKYASLIKEEDWGTLYFKADSELRDIQVGELTQILLNVNIDPLEKLTTIPPHYLDSSSIETFCIPEGIHAISTQAFQFCSKLKQVYIPKSIKYIGEYAFYYSENLKDITYEESPEEWKSIDKDWGWNDFTGPINVTHLNK